MQIIAALLDEHRLVDAGVCELPQVRAQLLRRADATGTAAERLESDLVAHGLVALPDVRAAGLVLAEPVEVTERELEEPEAVRAAAQRLLLVRMTGEARHHGDVRVDGVADRHALALERIVVVLHPVLRFLRVDERKRQRAQPQLCRQVNRVAVRAGDPHRRMRLLHRLRNNVAHRHREVLALESGVRIHRHHVRDLLDGLTPHRAPLGRVDAEAFEFGATRRFARAEIDAAIRHQIERRDALGDTRGLVVSGRHQRDAMAEADVLRALRRRREKHLRRGRVRVLFEEVVLNFPRVVDAELVGEFNLRKRVLKQLLFATLAPRAR